MTQEEWERERLIEESKNALQNGRSVWDLGEVKLSELPAEVYKVVTLRVLHCKGQLRKISPSIASLDALQVLDLSACQLFEVPQEIGHLTGLRALHLHNNHISELPYSIGFLRQLQTLSLGCNHLTYLPYELEQCKHLQVLSLHNNRLTSMQRTLEELSSLLEINLSHNHIDYLYHLPPSLTRANLRANKLSELPVSHPLLRLKYLNIADNRFTSLPGELFLSPLIHVDISNNPLSDPNLFKLSVSELLITLKNTCSPEKIADLQSRVSNYWEDGSPRKHNKGKRVSFSEVNHYMTVESSIPVQMEDDRIFEEEEEEIDEEEKEFEVNVRVELQGETRDSLARPHRSSGSRPALKLR